MRRYVIRDHNMCTMPLRREIREPTRRNLNEPPEHSVTHVQMPVIPAQAASWSPSVDRRMDMGMHMEMHSMVFETIEFVTLVWVEEHTDFARETSCGHYNTFTSYFQVPRGAELPSSELINDGHSYHDEYTEPYRGLDGEAYYRYRMMELQRQLNRLETTRVILPREEITDIHAGAAVINNRPIRAHHFKDELFEVE